MSGLNQRFTKPSYLNWYREFESRSLRQKSKSHFEAETGSRRRRDTNAFPPPNPESKRVFHAPRGSKSTVRSLI